MKKSHVIFAVYVAVAALAQVVYGPFPVEAFEFPVNAAVLFTMTAGLWVLWRERPHCALSRWLTSGTTSLLLIAALCISAIVQGLVPRTDIVHGWFFIAIMTALLANLLMVVFSRAARPRFLLNHVGVFLALAGGFFGAADMSEDRVVAYRDGAEDGTAAAQADAASYMVLKDFDIETAGDGSVSNYKATVLIDGSPAEIKVNHPYHRNLFEDVYLLSYDNSGTEVRHCTLGIVRQPWKYAIWLGIIMMMAGCVLMFTRGVKTMEGRA